MLFNSIDFLIFFPIVVLIYYIIPKKAKHIWLLVSSYYFYMCWNVEYALLIAISTLVTFFAAILIERSESKRLRKTVLTTSIIVNLGILFFFKYFGFSIELVNRILHMVKLEAVSNPFDILLPVGISFYSFQALGYAIDVYRGDCSAQKNILKYALFVSFFPQLVAGPIERSKNLQKQINELSKKRLWNYDGIISGLITMLWGLFMKMVISDRISIFVDSVYANYYSIGTVEVALSAIGFSLQIYCDFAGYSAMAIGAARVMGFSLMENFDTPYFATSIADFWRRWHISLSTWFRDYLYIPLGGNRNGRARKYINLMVTFLVSGLWHGADLTYVVWGAIHGIYQIIGDLLRPIKEAGRKILKIDTETFSFKFGQMSVTFLLTSFAWIFFRAITVKQAILIIGRMFTCWNPWAFFNEVLFEYGLDRREVGILFGAIIVLIVVDLLKYIRGITISEFLVSENLWFRWAVVILLVVAVLVYGEYGANFDSKQFIYFAF